ncbi:hypothetical protein CNMCM5793_006738 [Aspergillus hiratsukae]|uniref:Uncharacterized protein n=1 Tax=Aspergillus hiratsukae TaxID=1194566 RepID=A0A8H6QKN5_9EURO|nr:hypothetical protein CNMCM5793_006738 [Aspergillus hiratsukae]KAF7173602.1 hypothetical protein CNMCM6106_007681 [Aspergillus hiratsukae]
MLIIEFPTMRINIEFNSTILCVFVIVHFLAYVAVVHYRNRASTTCPCGRCARFAPSSTTAGTEGTEGQEPKVNSA